MTTKSAFAAEYFSTNEGNSKVSIKVVNVNEDNEKSLVENSGNNNVTKEKDNTSQIFPQTGMKQVPILVRLLGSLFLMVLLIIKMYQFKNKESHKVYKRRLKK